MIKFIVGVATGSIIPLLADNLKLYRECRDLRFKLDRAEHELKMRSNTKTFRSSRIIGKDGVEYPIGFH